MKDLRVGEEHDCGYIRRIGRTDELVTVRRDPDGYRVIRRSWAGSCGDYNRVDHVVAVYATLDDAVTHGRKLVERAAAPYLPEPDPLL